MPDYAIEINGLTKYFGSVKGVENVNLKVRKGSIYALLGLNGSGKTTLVKLLTGQIFKDVGEIKIFNSVLEPGSAVQLNSKIGYVSESKSMYDFMTCKQMLELCKSFYGSWNQDVVNRCMDVFDISCNKKIKTLSKGTRCQLALTMSMGGNPDLLILDEPTEGLDPLRRNEFLSILLDVLADSEKTVFMATNNINDVEKLADNMGIIRNGQICLQGETQALISNFKKIRVAFKEDYNCGFDKWEGVYRVEQEKRSYLLHINKNADDIIEKLKQTPAIFMDVINLNLEDIFMDISRGNFSNE